MKKSNLRKRISNRVVCGLAAIMAVGAFGMGSITAFATNNYEDSGYDFSFDYGNTCNTNTRIKEDTSAAYMNCTSVDGNDYGYTAYVYSNGQSHSYGYNFYSGTVSFVSNSLGYGDPAYFHGELNSYDAVGYRGLWSPDNYNCYH